MPEGAAKIRDAHVSLERDVTPLHSNPLVRVSKVVQAELTEPPELSSAGVTNRSQRGILV